MCRSSDHHACFARSLSAIHLTPPSAAEGGVEGKVSKRHRDGGVGSPLRRSKSLFPLEGHTLLPPLPFSTDDRQNATSQTPSILKPTRKLHRRSTSPSTVDIADGHPKPARVTFAPSNRADERAADEEGAPRRGARCSGYRRDYALGQTVRIPSHMVVEPTPERAALAAGALRKHDFAFVRRSNGSFSYAILAERSVDRQGRERMTFVMDGMGSTKTVRRGHWGGSVRAVSCP